MSDLFALVYVSSSNSFFTEVELNEQLINFRRSNIKHDITGLLLYRDGSIMQSLEGRKQDV